VSATLCVLSDQDKEPTGGSPAGFTWPGDVLTLTTGRRSRIGNNYPVMPSPPGRCRRLAGSEPCGRRGRGGVAVGAFSAGSAHGMLRTQSIGRRGWSPAIGSTRPLSPGGDVRVDVAAGGDDPVDLRGPMT
jgi:hypothetical protein